MPSNSPTLVRIPHGLSDGHMSGHSVFTKGLALVAFASAGQDRRAGHEESWTRGAASEADSTTRGPSGMGGQHGSQADRSQEHNAFRPRGLALLHKARESRLCVDLF